MKISEAYNNSIIEEFFTNLAEEHLIQEGTVGLEHLLDEANDEIFRKFQLNPNERRYCITGSATLYLYPKLREAFGLSGKIGDLDMVIPEKQLWDNAGLSEDYMKGYYRPTNDIEVFTVWDPSKAGGEYADVKVRSTTDIIKSAIYAQGYYFMSLPDVIDYKLAMNRGKEKQVVQLIYSYYKSDINNRTAFLKKMADLIGFNETKALVKRMEK